MARASKKAEGSKAGKPPAAIVPRDVKPWSPAACSRPRSASSASMNARSTGFIPRGNQVRLDSIT